MTQSKDTFREERERIASSFGKALTFFLGDPLPDMKITRAEARQIILALRGVDDTPEAVEAYIAKRKAEQDG